MTTGVPSNAARDYRVTPPKGGTFTPGNRRSTYLGRTDGEIFGRSIANPANPQEQRIFRKAKTAATKRAERVERKTAGAKPCVGCGMKVYVPRTCFCW